MASVKWSLAAHAARHFSEVRHKVTEISVPQARLQLAN